MIKSYVNIKYSVADFKVTSVEKAEWKIVEKSLFLPAIFYVSEKEALQNSWTWFLFHQKSSFRSPDIQIFEIFFFYYISISHKGSWIDLHKLTNVIFGISHNPL